MGAREGKKKDPNAPKKPTGGGYGVFLTENRAKIVKSLPADHKMTDVGKVAGEQWRNLPAAAKKPYEDKSQKLMAEYRKAMEEYKKTHGADDDEDEDEDDEEDEEEEENAVAKKKARAGA